MSHQRLTHRYQNQQQPLQQQRVVLPEEEYQRNLSEVIQRQFYPDLPDLQAQASAQRKREVGDPAGAESVQRAAELLKVHDALVRQAEQEEEEGVATLRSKPRPLHLETLSGFHARVTSEDNADYETSQAEEMRQNRIERSKMLLLTNRPGGSNNTLPHQPPQLLPGGATPLFLASDAFDAPSDAARPKPREAPVENGFFFVPDFNAIPRGERGEDSDQRLLMPPPNLSTTTLASAAPASNQLVADPPSVVFPTANALVEYIPKRHLEKRIEPANTRFPKPDHGPMVPMPSGAGLSRPLEGDTAADDESTLFSGGDGREGSTPLSGDSDTDLDRDSVDGSSVGSTRLNELRRQAQKRKEREWQRLVPLSPVQPPFSSAKNSTLGDTIKVEHQSSLPTDDASSFQLPPTLPREVVAERAHELAQERSKRAGRQIPSSSSSSLSGAGASRRSGAAGSHLFPLSSSSSISGAQSVRSIFSTSSRPASARSRSALGTALRSAYGGGRGGGPASVVVGSSAIEARMSATATATTTTSRSVRSRSSRSTKEGR